MRTYGRSHTVKCKILYNDSTTSQRYLFMRICIYTSVPQFEITILIQYQYYCMYMVVTHLCVKLHVVISQRSLPVTEYVPVTV